MLNKTLVVYASDVYLDVLTPDESLPFSTELRFAVDVVQGEFIFGFGQMALLGDNIDFQALDEIVLDLPPDIPGGVVDIKIRLSVDTQKNLTVTIIYVQPGDKGDFGPYALD